MSDIEQQLEQTHDRRDVIGTLSEFSPDFVSMISTFCLGEVHARPTLSDNTKEVVAIVALISLGSERLRGHFESSLQLGMSKSELVEVVTLSSIYLGFPRAIDAMLVLNDAVKLHLSSHKTTTENKP